MSGRTRRRSPAAAPPPSCRRCSSVGIRGRARAGEAQDELVVTPHDPEEIDLRPLGLPCLDRLLHAAVGVDAEAEIAVPPQPDFGARLRPMPRSSGPRTVDIASIGKRFCAASASAFHLVLAARLESAGSATADSISATAAGRLLRRNCLIVSRPTATTLRCSDHQNNTIAPSRSPVNRPSSGADVERCPHGGDRLRRLGLGEGLDDEPLTVAARWSNPIPIRSVRRVASTRSWQAGYPDRRRRFPKTTTNM